MKKQFHKIKIAAENLSRSNRTENKNDELVKVEKQVDKYKDVLEKIYKKFSTSGSSDQDKEKRIKKINEYRLGLALEESSKELPTDLVLHHVLNKSGDLEKTIANYIVENEIQTENDVSKKLKTILESDLQGVSTHKRAVSRYLTEYNSIKKAYENAQKSNENMAKINQLKQDQEECESKLEKERDLWAAQMFDLLAKDEIIAYSIRDYIRIQKIYYEKSLESMTTILGEIDDIVDKCTKKRVFGVPLQEHLKSTNREISSIIELCCCCLLERGLQEEGLFRIGCGGTKLKRMKNAIDAQYVNPPLPVEYQDVHMIACILKSYLRELPEPLLTFKLYPTFIEATQRQTDLEKQSGIKNAINKLPKENYDNLKYLTKFLWCLHQKSDQNKMSSQNIAIVMSPNLLWPPDSFLNDYVGQVNSSAAVNTIVELLVSNWDFFFNGADVDFYSNLSRDNLFIDNNNGNSNISNYNNHNHNHNSNGAGSNIINTGFLETSNDHQQQFQKPSHSRSSSNDTSRILIRNSEFNSSSTTMGRSQSNDSISDTSPSNGSPKLPVRKKKYAPTPPPPKVNKAMSSSMHGKENGFQPQQLQYDSPNEKNLLTQKCDGASQTPPIVAASEKLNKPDKPPRPANPVECQTLNRSTFKNRSIDSKPLLSQTNKPVAMPRTIMNAVTKSNENLADSSIFEKPEIREKPIIPDRPVTLMRPTSFRSENQFINDSLKRNNESNSNNGNTSLKKASSFRAVSSSQQQQNNSGNGSKINSNLANSTSSLNSSLGSGNIKTTLERAQFYNVDKQLVSIINVTTESGTTSTTTISKSVRPTTLFDNKKETQELLENELTNTQPHQQIKKTPQSTSSETPTNTIPISPRGFNIKRPEVPAPPPPASAANRRKSDSTLGDSTNL